MNEMGVFSAAVAVLRHLRLHDEAAYLLYCSEQRRAWVAAARPGTILRGGSSIEAFLAALKSGNSGVFLASPNFAAECSAWPVGVFLQPQIQLEIDAQGIRCTFGKVPPELLATATDVLRKTHVVEATERGLVHWTAWHGEDDASFSERLTRAIAATRGRTGKVIVSRRFERDIGGEDPLKLLQLLGTAEPQAAAIHYVELPGGLISLGTSPENIVELDDGELSIDAVAGTRPSSGDDATDAAFQQDLLASTKERHEHDLATERALAFASAACQSGSARLLLERQVRTLRAVQHLHSRVAGRLAPGLDFATLVGRCHPPLNSYPAELATQFAPPWPGHFYGGMVGRVSGADGAAFLNLRCLEIEAQRVNIYAGVGIVDGSSLEEELAEVRNKLATVTDVIERWLGAHPQGGNS